MIRNQHLVVYMDNQGSCDIYRKGYSSTCFYSGTLVKAMHEVATCLNCTLHVEKITRCSNAGAIAADMLSKANFKGFGEIMPNRNARPSWVPRTIIKWLEDPRVTLDLGVRICTEKRESTEMLGHNIV